MSHTTKISSLSHEGRGISHHDGKTIFIDNALPGETVTFKYSRRHKSYDEAVTIEVENHASNRATPGCQHFGVCGGCNLQHMQSELQLQHKQQVLIEQLQHFGEVSPQQVLEPLHIQDWGYRRKARLGIKYVIKKEKLLIGFREKNGRYLADIEQCEVLDPRIGQRLDAVRECLSSLSIYQEIPQIEVAIGDNAVALIIRHLKPFNESDLIQLKHLAEKENFWLYLQPAGYESIHLIWPENSADQLFYELPDHQVKIFFKPNDFTQVNAELNRAMVNRTLKLLDPKPEDTILDLFCGLGNFTLPLARYAGKVVGVEGDLELVKRAKENAIFNNINAEFFTENLAELPPAALWLNPSYNKILLDPPRTGALSIVQHPTLFKSVQRVVYVSCNPATLARDAGILVKQQGFTLTHAGIMNMFPHTAHVESIAVFERVK